MWQAETPPRSAGSRSSVRSATQRRRVCSGRLDRRCVGPDQRRGEHKAALATSPSCGTSSQKLASPFHLPSLPVLQPHLLPIILKTKSMKINAHMLLDLASFTATFPALDNIHSHKVYGLSNTSIFPLPIVITFKEADALINQ